MKLRRPSPALLIACLALFISLGGVSYGVATGFIDSRELKNNTIRTQDIRNNDIRGKDLRNSSVQGRDVAFNTLTGSDIAESRLVGVNAKSVEGVALAGLVRTDATPFVNLSLSLAGAVVPGEQVPQFDVDPLGYVHLRGVVAGTGTVAVLPAGSRPVANSYFAGADVPVSGASPVTVEPDGDVITTGTVSLDGITFKAGG